jgi:ribose 1,5-bisphosphokinase
VGPSGAGKDTVMGIARGRLADEPRVHFVRRVITRPADVNEDHEPVTAEEFATRVARGTVALHWCAHGLSYGLPAAALRRIDRGHVVVANISRGVLPGIAARFARHLVVEVTADEALRAARLAGRSRPTDGSLAARVARQVDFDRENTVVIDNSGDAAVAGASLERLIRGQVI